MNLINTAVTSKDMHFARIRVMLIISHMCIDQDFPSSCEIHTLADIHCHCAGVGVCCLRGSPYTHHQHYLPSPPPPLDVATTERTYASLCIPSFYTFILSLSCFAYMLVIRSTVVQFPTALPRTRCRSTRSPPVGPPNFSPPPKVMLASQRSYSSFSVCRVHWADPSGRCVYYMS